MPDYASYLRLDELLALQDHAGEHDEHLFIVVHQSYELWFKQILREIDYLNARLDEGDLARANHTMGRILVILKVLVTKVDILETLTPLEFLAFRDRLEAGSGFQSLQFRALEFALGHKREAPLQQYASGSRSYSELQQRLRAPGLWDHFLRFLATQGVAVPETQLQRDVSQPPTPDPALQAVLIEVYRNSPPLAEFCERMVDLDEGLQEWRYRHVQMVQRTIGNKPGTGGSSGAEYLATTLLRPLFPDLWAIRTEF